MNMSRMTKKRIKVGNDLDRFAGKWVALLDNKVVDVADQLPTLVLKMKQKKIERKASVMLVPRKDEGPYILFVV